MRIAAPFDVTAIQGIIISSAISSLDTSVRKIPFRAALRLLDSAQKPGHGVPAYMRWVNRRAARYLCAAASHLGASPAQVSVLSLLVTFLGLGVFLALLGTSLLAGPLAAVLLALGFALDSADGQLSRLQGTSSLQGEWLDHSLDAIRQPTVHLTLAAAFVMVGPAWAAIAAAAFSVVSSAFFLSQILGGLLRDRAAAGHAGARRGQSWLLLPADPGVLYWLFALWPLMPVFLVLYLALLAANALRAAASAYRRSHELKKVDPS